MSNTLKPCPFCGSAKVFFYHLHRQATHRHHPFVLCHGCSARINGEEGDYGVDATTAVAAWNRRDTPVSADRIEELEDKLAKAVDALSRIQAGSYGKNAAMARTALAEMGKDD